jgi:hypothetical protein
MATRTRAIVDTLPGQSNTPLVASSPAAFAWARTAGVTSAAGVGASMAGAAGARGSTVACGSATYLMPPSVVRLGTM